MKSQGLWRVTRQQDHHLKCVVACLNGPSGTLASHSQNKWLYVAKCRIPLQSGVCRIKLASFTTSWFFLPTSLVPELAFCLQYFYLFISFTLLYSALNFLFFFHLIDNLHFRIVMENTLIWWFLQIPEMEADTQGLWVSEPSSRFRMAFLIAIHSFVMKRKLGRELYPYIFKIGVDLLIVALHDKNGILFIFQ